MQDLHGEFKDVPVAKLLSWLRNNQHTGILRLTHGQQRKEFRFLLGESFYFRSNFSGEQIETLLAKQGIAEFSYLENLRKECRKNKESFARKLLAKKLLTKKEWLLWLKQSVYLALDNASRWTVGTFAFRFLSEDQVGKQFIVSPKAEPNTLSPPSYGSIIADEKIFSVIQERIGAGQIELPPMPHTMIKIQECLHDPNWDNKDLLKIIMADQLLTSSILKAANSSLYGFSSSVSSLQHAIVLMGMKTIWGIVTHQSLLGSFSNQKEQIQQVLDHSFFCALLARQIAQSCKCDEDEAFTCGLLHDIGKIVLYNLLADSEYPHEIQEKIVARFHGEAGLLLAARWNLPELVLETIEYHHHPEQASDNHTLVEVVYVANCLAYNKKINSDILVSLDLENVDTNLLADQAKEFIAATQ